MFRMLLPSLLIQVAVEHVGGACVAVTGQQLACPVITYTLLHAGCCVSLIPGLTALLMLQGAAANVCCALQLLMLLQAHARGLCTLGVCESLSAFYVCVLF
jgi:hypothetical protein